MTDDQLRAIRERAERATKPPWCFDSYCRIAAPEAVAREENVAYVETAHGDAAINSTSACACGPAVSRSDVPALLEEVARRGRLLKSALLGLRVATNDLDEIGVSGLHSALRVELVRVAKDELEEWLAALAGDAEKGVGDG
jgi:hypothetical protein